MTVPPSVQSAGSSPHTRGAPWCCRGRAASRGDHPRIRGEHRRESIVCTSEMGIIPAYAGSTSLTVPPSVQSAGSSPHTRGAPWCCRGRAASRGDHPRIRGEHKAFQVLDKAGAGIIPAYAGSTPLVDSPTWYVWGSSPHTRGAPRPSTAISRQSWDHPRIRGEHVQIVLVIVDVHGIIPAYAGSTRPVLARVVRSRGSSPHTRGAREGAYGPGGALQDHPRIRGERGDNQIPARFKLGIIPAYAGSADSDAVAAHRRQGSSPHTRGARHIRSSLPMPVGDHPRIRGERLGEAQRLVVGRGIIPAYAGSAPPAPDDVKKLGGSSPHTRGARAV